MTQQFSVDETVISSLKIPGTLIMKNENGDLGPLNGRRAKVIFEFGGEERMVELEV